jgi:hypothetical protein
MMIATWRGSSEAGVSSRVGLSIRSIASTPAREQWVVRRSGGRAVCGSLDLEDLLFLGPTDAIDVVDVTVGRLDDLQELVDLVRPEVAFALELLEVIGSVARRLRISTRASSIRLWTT